MDDLYREINGHWLDTHEIPADRSSDGAFYELRDESEKAVHELLKKDTGLGGTLFAKFLNQRGTIDDLDPDLQAIAAADSIDELFRVHGELDRTGVAGPLGFYVTKDAQGTNDVAFVYQSGLGLPEKEYYTSTPEILADYEQHVARMLRFLPDFAEADAADKAAAKIVQFESELASHHWDKEDTRDAIKSYNPTTVEELPARARAFLTAAGAHGKIINRTPSFLEALQSLEDLEQMKLWSVWQVLGSRAHLLSDEISKANFDFYGTRLSGAQEQRARWKRAVGFAEQHVGEEIGKLYVVDHFPPTHKAEMMRLVDYLLGAYNERIRSLEWMTEETKQKALDKLAKFTPNVGYPDKWRDFSELTITDQMSLVECERVCHAFNHDYGVGKIGQPSDPSEWHMTPQTVNAYYSPNTNGITFPAAILQAPFYSPQASDAANFGGIGAVIGHEIGHGFDDQGSRYDGDGMLNSWWTDEDRAAFEQLTAKLVDQFDGLVPSCLEGTDSKGVNGRFTLGENIGDLGGLGIALVAYKNFAGEDADLKEFFSNWARVWRSKTRPEMAAQLLSIDPHSPAEFRCNVIAANIDDFYDTFEVGAMAIPAEDRVRIW
ncbi:M13 family metallopeptidase [Corynebacterium aquilae]|uniref:Peptidase M13 n=1 Tax=Corynebacterium aquilae DSM 44791 TaxID=1431546 RepID=A0A1L7CD79_9CORY|nr:M13-type metalloendopeptidase [Corynebacterium aquilae]APT83799.1 peptidase M13 [Corynebacterium aquilae DSM 44791]